MHVCTLILVPVQPCVLKTVCEQGAYWCVTPGVEEIGGRGHVFSCGNVLSYFI